MFDNHIHSSFSGDSQLPIEEACKRAVELGLKGVAFTDHLDFDYPGYDDTSNIDFTKYLSCLDRIEHLYSGRLKIIKGVEAGIQPHVIKDTLDVISRYGFDFVIGSVHIIDRLDPYTGEFYNGRTKLQAYSRYLEEVIFAIDNFDNFDILGHIDYVIRYGNYSNRSLIYNDHKDLLDSIFRKLINSGKGMEINTSSYRDKPGITTPVFDWRILARYKELGGDIVTLGSDAHSAEYIGYKFEYFKEMLKKTGFKYLTHFEGRKPVFDLLD